MTQQLCLKQIVPFLHGIAEKLHLKNAELHLTNELQDGDGFISYPQFIQLKYDGGELKLVIKEAPRHELYRKQLFVREIYLNEIYFYEKVIEYFKNFQERRNVVYNPFPKYYGALTSDNEVLVIENLKSSGYVMPDPFEISEVEVKLIFEELAKFHAVWFAAKKQDSYKILAEGLYRNLDTYVELSGVTDSIVEQCENIERIFCNNRDKVLLQKLKHFREAKLEKILNCYDIYKNKFSVIIHGDARTHNLMIKYKNGIPVGVRFYDFQVSRIGSVIQDLSYVFYTGCRKDEFKKLEDFQRLYHEALLKQIRLLGYEEDSIFTFEEFQEEWNKHCLWGFAMAIVVLHSMHFEKGEIPNLQEVLEGGGSLFCALNFISKNESVYERKIRDVIEHLVEFNHI